MKSAGANGDGQIEYGMESAPQNTKGQQNKALNKGRKRRAAVITNKTWMTTIIYLYLATIATVVQCSDLKIRPAADQLAATVGSTISLVCSSSSKPILCLWKTPYGHVYTLSEGVFAESGRLKHRDDSISDNDNECGLDIVDVEDRDHGQWECEVGALIGDTFQTATANISLEIRSESQTFHEGQTSRQEVGNDVILHCSADREVHLCRWKTPYLNTYIVGEGIYVERGRIQWLGTDPNYDCTIRVANLDLRDAGTWVCEIGSSTKESFQVQTKEFVIDIETPLKLSAPTALMQNANTDATLVCHANKPYDECLWTTPYGATYRFPSKSSSHENGRIAYFGFADTDCGVMVRNVEPKDNGGWQCQLHSRNGDIFQNATDVVNLFAESTPRLVAQPRSIADYDYNTKSSSTNSDYDAIDYVNGDFDKVEGLPSTIGHQTSVQLLPREKSKHRNSDNKNGGSSSPTSSSSTSTQDPTTLFTLSDFDGTPSGLQSVFELSKLPPEKTSVNRFEEATTVAAPLSILQKTPDSSLRLSGVNPLELELLSRISSTRRDSRPVRIGSNRDDPSEDDFLSGVAFESSRTNTGSSSAAVRNSNRQSVQTKNSIPTEQRVVSTEVPTTTPSPSSDQHNSDNMRLLEVQRIRDERRRLAIARHREEELEEKKRKEAQAKRAEEEEKKRREEEAKREEAKRVEDAKRAEAARRAEDARRKEVQRQREIAERKRKEEAEKRKAEEEQKLKEEEERKRKAEEKQRLVDEQKAREEQQRRQLIIERKRLEERRRKMDEQRRKEAEERKRKEEEERKQKEEEEKKKKEEEEQKRLEEHRKRQQEERRKKEEEEKRQKEEEKKKREEEEKRKMEIERRKKAEEELRIREQQRQRRVEELKRKREEERKRREEAERQRKEELRKIEEEKKRKEEEEKKKKEEDERKRRLDAERKRKEDELKQRLEADRRRKEEEARRQAALERKRQEDIRRHREEIERKRKEEEERLLKEIERKKKEEAEEARKEAEKKKKEEEERAKQLEEARQRERQERLRIEAAKREEERHRRLDQQRKRDEADRLRKLEAEKLRKEEEERQRRLEEEREKEREKKRQEDLLKKQREDERRQALERIREDRLRHEEEEAKRREDAEKAKQHREEARQKQLEDERDQRRKAEIERRRKAEIDEQQRRRKEEEEEASRTFETDRSLLIPRTESPRSFQVQHNTPPNFLPGTEREEDTRKKCYLDATVSNGNITCGTETPDRFGEYTLSHGQKCDLTCKSGYVSLEQRESRCLNGRLTQRLECVRPDALLLLAGRSDTFGVLNTVELVTGRGVCRGAVPELPAMRWRMIAESIDHERVLACGGVNIFGDPKNNCWSLGFRPDPYWTPAANMLVARDAAAWALEGNFLLVLGGSLGKLNGYTDSVEMHNVASGRWLEGPRMSSSRYSHCAVALGNGSIIVTGGYGGLEMTERLDLDTGTWWPLPELNPVRAQHGCALVDLHGEQGVLVVGGDSGGTRLKDVRFLAIDNPRDGWRKVADLNTARWGRPGVAMVGGRITVAAGWDGTRDLDTVEYYDEKTEKWRLTASRLQTERRWPASTPISLSLFPKCAQKRE